MSDVNAPSPGPIPTVPPASPELPATLVAGALVLPSREAFVALLPKGQVICEVGVALGYFSRAALVACAPGRYIAIDTFKLHELPEFWGRPTRDYFGDLSHADWYRAHFAEEIAAGRMDVMEGDSVAMLERLDDASVDVVYVDAHHTYEAVSRELDVVARKLKPDGYVMIDDYVLVDQLRAEAPLGVVYATNEFMLSRGWGLHYLCLQPHGFYLAVLRPGAQPAPAVRLEREILTLRDDLARMRASTSWRLSAPLRALGRLLGRP